MINIVIYYSTIMSFHQIRSREHAKYETVVHCNVPVWLVYNRANTDGKGRKKEQQWPDWTKNSFWNDGSSKTSFKHANHLSFIFSFYPIKLKTFNWLSELFTSFVRAIYRWTDNAGCISKLLPKQRSQNNKFFCSGIINLLFDGFTYNTRGHFAHCSYFSSPLRGTEKYYTTRKISTRIICKTIE